MPKKDMRATLEEALDAKSEGRDYRVDRSPGEMGDGPDADLSDPPPEEGAADGDGGDADGGGGDGAGAGAEPKAGEGDGEGDGDGKGAAAEGADGEPPAAEPEAKPKKGAKAKEKDAEGDEEDELYKPVEGLSQRGKERFDKLVARSKELTAKNQEQEQELAQAREKVSNLDRVMTDTHLTPDQAAQLFGTLVRSEMEPQDKVASLVIADAADKAVKEGNPELAGQVLDYLMPVVTRLAGVCGRDIGGADPLAEFPDLAERVKKAAEEAEAYGIESKFTLADAVEIANGRRRDKMHERRTAAENERRAQEEAERTAAGESEAARKGVEKQLADTISALAKNHSDHGQRISLMQELGMFDDIRAMPIEQRVAAFQDKYKRAGDQLAKTVRRPAPNSLTRSRTGTAAGKPKPRNMGEALFGAGGALDAMHGDAP